MDLRGFLDRVLPPTGNSYFGAAINGNKKLQQTKLNSIESLERFIKANMRNDVYYATGTYDNKRDSKSAQLKKTFYIDIDCGAESAKYPDKKTAITELLAFSKNCFIKPNLIVDSGGGLHAYWVLDKAIQPARWSRNAEALKRLCADNNLKADPSPTADVARILRAPFSLNYKNAEHPRHAKIIFESDRDYTIDQIELKLSTINSQPFLSLAVNNDDLFVNQTLHLPKLASRMIEQCPMFADALATGGKDVPEMLWVQQLHVLAFCDDGANYAHEISKLYTGYAQAETQLKWNQRVQAREKAGPTLCNTFNKYSPHCVTCAHRGLISTPLQLGVDRDPFLPHPYDQDEKGVFILEEEKDDMGMARYKKVRVVSYQLHEFNMLQSPGKTTLTFSAKVGKRRALHVEIDYADIMDRRTCVGVLSGKHVIISDNEYNGFRNLMSAWTKRMQEVKASSQKSWDKLGWTEDHGFVMPDFVIMPNDRREPNFTADKVLADIYTPKGERDAWVALSHAITAQKRHAITTMILTSFAAPLMKWVRDSSAVVSFVSSKSGTGKSTAMQIAQAVWGNPKLGINQLNDTHASILKKISFLNNLPAYWDEIRIGENTFDFMSMMFQMTGGKERTRLTANIEMRDSGSWNTMLVTASNSSLADYAETTSPDSEAGRARIFEIEVPKLEINEINAMINQKMLLLNTNYGHIGEEYAQYLVDHHAVIEALINNIYEKMTKKLMHDSSERFWVATVSVLVVAAMLTTKLGLTKLDVNDYTKWIMAQMEEQRAESMSNFGTETERALDVLYSFMQRHRTQTAVFEHLPGAEGVGQLFYTPLIGEIVASIATVDCTIRVNYALFRRWIQDNKMGSMKLIMKELKEIGAWDKRTRLTGGVGNALDHDRTRCVELILPPALIKQLGDGSTDFED